MEGKGRPATAPTPDKHRFFNDGPKRNRTMELNRALSIMGFGTWNNLEPDNEKQKQDKAKIEGEGAAASVVEKLNKTMFIKLQEIEAKREKATALERRLSKMADGPKKRQMVYQKQQEEATAIKYKRTPVDEERALHEAYQILLRECEFRRLRNEKLANMSEGSRLRLLSAEEKEEEQQRADKADKAEKSGRKHKSKNSEKKKSGSGRRSPSPLSADAKRRASGKVDDSESADEFPLHF